MSERKGKPAPAPFEGHTVYGPVLHSKNGRRYMHLINDQDKSKRWSTSLARYMMSVHLGRLLSKEEQVDHINNDPTDDRIENFQLLSQLENIKKSPQPRTADHGSLTSYSHHKCRCDLCRAAWNLHCKEYKRTMRAKKKAEKEGGVAQLVVASPS